MLSFVLLNGGAVAAALLAVRAALPGARTSLLLLAALSGYALVVHTATLVAGIAGRLTVGGVALILSAMLVVIGYHAWRAVGHASAASTVDRPPFTPAELFPPLAALAVAAMWAWPHVVHATRLWIWDDYTYHMVYPVLWLREHAIAAPMPAQSFTMQAWYPLSASVVASWYMLPFDGSRGDALAWVSLTGVLYAAIAASGTAELLARLGCRRGAWAVPVVLVLTSSRVGIMASSFSDTDLAQAAALFAALVFAIPRPEAESPRETLVDGAYAALLTGLAIGVKVSAIPIGAIVLLVIVLRAGLRVRMVVVFVAAWTITGAYWYARNWWHTGNPFYPAAFLAWPGVTFPATTLREYSAHYGLARTVRDALAVYLNWPLPHALLALAGVVALAGGLVVRRPRTRGPRAFATVALVITAVMLAVLPSAPYSAGNRMTFVSGFIHWDSMRYVALLPLLGWAALGSVLDAGAGAPRWRTTVAIVLTAGSLLVSGPPSWPPLLAGLPAIAAVIVTTAPVPRVPAIGRRVVIGAALLAFAVIVVWSHGAKAAATASSIHREPLFGAAAAVLDREAPGTRVAVFGDQWIYPAFGDRGHLSPVRVDANGRLATRPIGGEMTQGPLTVDPATFGANLRSSGVSVVVIVHMPHPGRAPEWPSQHRGLSAMAGVSRLHEDRAVSVWRVDSPPRG